MSGRANHLRSAPPPPANAFQRISRSVGYGGAPVLLPTLVGARQLGRTALEDPEAMATLLSTIRRAPASKTEHDVEIMAALQSAVKTAMPLWEKRPA